MTAIRKATIKDIPALAETLSLAFEHDPIIDWIFRDDAKRLEAIDNFFNYFLNECIPFKEVAVTEELNACAAWVPPGTFSETPSILDYLKMLPEILNWTGIGRLLRYIEVDRVDFSKMPKAPHFYLVFLGVHPDHQGKGLGSKLLDHTLSHIDELNASAYLESSKATNIPLYESHGFKVIDKFSFRDEGPTEWFMWRDPKNASGS